MTIVPGTSQDQSQGQTEQNGDFAVELNRGPSLPRDGPHLPEGRFLIVPSIVPPKMCMFIGFFLARLNSPDSRGNGRNLFFLSSPHSRDCLESLESLENASFGRKPPFPKDPFF